MLEILGAVARVHLCCLVLDLHVWSSEVTLNQRSLLHEQRLVVICQANLVRMWSAGQCWVDSAGNGLAEHSVKEVKAKAHALAHAVFVLLNVTLDPKDSSGRLDGTMGGDANQHREKGPEWADSLVMAICSCIGAPDRRIWRDSSLHEDT